jgi:hypothetical protein
MKSYEIQRKIKENRAIEQENETFTKECIEHRPTVKDRNEF